MTPAQPSKSGSRRRWFRRAAVLALSTVAVIGAVNIWMVKSAAQSICRDPARVPGGRVALVLGTGARLKSGRENLHFATRMDAAAELYRSGKARHLLLSGDNHIQGYDEPTDMKNALLARGVPENVMTLDYAGFRTLDSMARARRVFQQDQIIVVTESFHAARSVFLARHFDLDATVYCAKELPAAWNFKSSLREIGARAKAALDVYVLRRGPHFLGEPISIPARPA